jgi:hypothetical protein
MSKKGMTYQEGEEMPDPDIETVEDAISPEPVPAEPLPFERRNWMGVKEVLMCVQCGGFRDKPDQMISHLISHYPQPAPVGIREKLESLFKEN